MQVRVQCFNKL